MIFMMNLFPCICKKTGFDNNGKCYIVITDQASLNERYFVNAYTDYFYKKSFSGYGVCYPTKRDAFNTLDKLKHLLTEKRFKFN